MPRLLGLLAFGDELKAGAAAAVAALRAEGVRTVLLSGDTLFSGTVGRTDFIGGSAEDMKASMRKLAFLPDETVVLPGHGDATTIGAERERTFARWAYARFLRTRSAFSAASAIDSQPAPFHYRLQVLRNRKETLRKRYVTLFLTFT